MDQKYMVRFGSQQKDIVLPHDCSMREVLLGVRDELDLPNSLELLKIEGYTTGKKYRLFSAAPTDEVIVVQRR